MRILVTILLLVFGVSALSRPLLGSGWSWDAANALGLAAFAALLYSSVPIGGSRARRRHELTSYVLTALIVLHALWLLVTDAGVAEYLKPGAPWYMWSGVASVMLIFLSLLLSVLPARQATFRDHGQFKRWHRVISVAAIATALYHIIGSGLYFSGLYQSVTLVVLTSALVFSQDLKWLARQSAVASPLGMIALSLVLVCLFVMARNIS